MSALAGLRVLVVGINYAPEHTGIAPYTTDACEHLAREGAVVDVLSGVPHYPHWSVPDDFRRVLATSSRPAGVGLTRLWHYVPPRQDAVRRGLYELTFGVHALTRRVGRPDVVVGVVPSLLGSVAAGRIARRTGAPLVVWVQDLIGRAAAQSGVAGGGVAARATDRIERHLLRSADRVVVINDVFRDAVVDSGVAGTRVDVVRNWSHVEAATTDPAPVRARLGWGPQETIVLHTGNMGYKQGLTNVVDAARVAAGTAPGVRFVLMGDGSQRHELEAAARDVASLDILPPADAADYPAVLAAADVLLVNERASAVDMSLPSKLTSYFRAGVPVVAAVPTGGSTAREIARADAGVVVRPEQPRELVEAVVGLVADRARCDALAGAGRRYAEEYLSAPRALDQLAAAVLRARRGAVSEVPS